MTFTDVKRLLSAALFLLLVDSKAVKAEVYNTTQLVQIKKFEDKDIMVCLRPLSRNPGEDLVVARLMVQSTARMYTYPAGNSTLDKLAPNSWHYVSIKQDEETYEHILKVEVNGQTIAFNKAKDTFWVSAFKFKEVVLLSKGTVQVTNCPPPEDPTTTTTATTTTTTKATTEDTTKATTATAATEYYFIIISVIVGLAICILVIIICKRRCRCCQENDANKRRESSCHFQQLAIREDEVAMEFSPNSPHVSSVSFDSNRTPIFSNSTDALPVTSHVTVCESYSSPYEVRRDVQFP